MPSRSLVARELATLFGVLANPARVRIIEELRGGELDVNSLQAALDVSHSRVSQHLGVLRAHRLVAERREGRHVFYHLCQPELAQWIVAGLDFIHADLVRSEQMRSKLEEVRALWSEQPEPVETNGSGR